MAKPELGTKRTCPESGKNFYDLNKDPIVSPYTGKEYPLSFFIAEVEQKKTKVEASKTADKPEDATDGDDEDTVEEEDGPEIISLEDADEASDDDDDDEDIEAIADLPSVDIEDEDDDDDDLKPDDDTFLEEEDEDTDLSDVIGTQDSNEKDEV